MIADYKNTLNLPNTKFPMKANLSSMELNILKKWEGLNVYNLIRAKNANKPKFVLHDGPPYANGKIHIGHAVNKILKDIIVKSKNLLGFDAPFIPGWDCHGLPIELHVEKNTKSQAKVDKLAFDQAEFREKCRKYAISQIAEQMTGFKRLGVIADWENRYQTMDYTYEASIVRALYNVYNNGYLKRSYKPVYWCPSCSSALAEAEIEYYDIESSAIDVGFLACDTSEVLSKFNLSGLHGEDFKIYFPIWTTTPWTLQANQAVALNSEFTYALIKIKTFYMVIAKTLIDPVKMKYSAYGEIAFDSVIAEIQGNMLNGIELHHPFFLDKNVKVIMSDHVNLESGTGLVHIAPKHGPDDYALGLKYNLSQESFIDKDLRVRDEIDIFGKMTIKELSNATIDILREKENLFCVEKIKHTYPHCWRHKIPVIYLATEQWFVDLNQTSLKANCMQSADDVAWIPVWGKERMKTMLDNRPDWCISRQRYWGVPIPLLINKQSRELHPDTKDIMLKVADLIQKSGVNAWHNAKIADLISEQDAHNYEKCTDVLDVWFDSGVSHYAVLNKKFSEAQNDEAHMFNFANTNRANYNYADLYLEGSDQYRGWFQTSLITSCAITGKAPYAQVLTHGFTVDEFGRKMSKSIGNVINPDDVIAKYGADIIRLWVAASDYSSEISISDEILLRTAENYRRIRNTIRFLLSNLYDFDIKSHKDFEFYISLDVWILNKIQVINENIIDCYKNYDFTKITKIIQNFCIVDLGSLYLDIIKDRQYTMQANSIGRKSAQITLYHILQYLLRWIAPILSFTAEEVLNYIPSNSLSSIFLSDWYEIDINSINKRDKLKSQMDLINVNMSEFWDIVFKIRNDVNREIELMRNIGAIGSSLEASVYVNTKSDSKIYKILRALDEELKFVFIVSMASVDSSLEFNSEKDYTIRVSQVKDAKKCQRCWHRYAAAVDGIACMVEDAEICSRCKANLHGKGEERFYA